MNNHRLIGYEVQCIERKNEVGKITFYNPENGDMKITYNDNEDVFLTHISKCKIVK